MQTRRTDTHAAGLTRLKCALVMLAACGAIATAQEGKEPAIRDLVRYHGMLEAYAAGNDADGLDALLSYNPRRLDAALSLATSADDPFFWDARRFGLAAMLHADAAFRLHPYAITDEAFRHIERAASLLQRGIHTAPDQAGIVATR